MMFGGGGMLGIGLLAILLAIGLPVLLVIALAAGGAEFLRNRNRSEPDGRSNTAQSNTAAVQSGQSTTSSARYCAHCGAGLQADWTHCPQCGAPIN